MSRSYMAEKPAQANIQCVVMHLVKINKTKLGRFQLLKKAGVNFTVGESAFSVNLEWGCADKWNINYSERSSDAFTVDKNMHKCMDPKEPLIIL